jgi:hypothetical protein
LPGSSDVEALEGRAITGRSASTAKQKKWNCLQSYILFHSDDGRTGITQDKTPGMAPFSHD